MSEGDDLANDLVALALMRIEHRGDRRMIELIDRAMTIITRYLASDDEGRVGELERAYEALAAELRASGLKARPAAH